MIEKEFTVNKRDFNKRKRSILKYCMTRALRAHTLNEFSVDEANNVATCKVRLMRQRMIFQIKTQFYAYYYTEKIPWNKREVRLKLHISTIEPDSA